MSILIILRRECTNMYITLDNHLASDVKIYVDDLRITGATRELTQTVARRTIARVQFLGIQDAPRKRRLDNRLCPGDTGSTSTELITKSVTDSKQTKGQEIIKALIPELKETPNNLLEFKILERDIRVFLYYMVITCDQIFSYLKGFHLSFCGHLCRMSEEGWTPQGFERIGHVKK